MKIIWEKDKRSNKKPNVAATYIPTRGPGSIIGDERLDFQVRNGTGYDPLSNPTTKSSKFTNVNLILFIELK